jgi:allantoate deiminase
MADHSSYKRASASPTGIATLSEVVVGRCAELAAFSDLDAEISRALGGHALDEAMAATERWMRAAGLDCRRDGFGNLIGRTESDPKAPVLLLGSHLDTVPGGGRYDGALGVMAATALVERLPANLPFAIEVIAFADEEGRFDKGCLGSRSYVGELTGEHLVLSREDGRTLGECLGLAGRDPQRAVERSELPAHAIGYCEVHIEQDTVLEELGVPVGVVGTILGKTRARVELTGVAAHPATGIESRRDASCGLSELVLAAERSMREDGELRTTLGELHSHPQAVNVVPGRATASVDMRHPDDHARRAAFDRLETEAATIAAARDLDLAWTAIEETDTAVADHRLTAALEAAAGRVGLRPPTLASFAGHDAAVIAGHVPISMLFVRCCDGISHHPDEDVAIADVEAALEVLAEFVSGLAATMPSGARA